MIHSILHFIVCFSGRQIGPFASRLWKGQVDLRSSRWRLCALFTSVPGKPRKHQSGGQYARWRKGLDAFESLQELQSAVTVDKTKSENMHALLELKRLVAESNGQQGIDHNAAVDSFKHLYYNQFFKRLSRFAPCLDRAGLFHSEQILKNLNVPEEESLSVVYSSTEKYLLQATAEFVQSSSYFTSQKPEELFSFAQTFNRVAKKAGVVPLQPLSPVNVGSVEDQFQSLLNIFSAVSKSRKKNPEVVVQLAKRLTDVCEKLAVKKNLSNFDKVVSLLWTTEKSSAQHVAHLYISHLIRPGSSSEHSVILWLLSRCNFCPSAWSDEEVVQLRNLLTAGPAHTEDWGRLCESLGMLAKQISMAMLETTHWIVKDILVPLLARNKSDLVKKELRIYPVGELVFAMKVAGFTDKQLFEKVNKQLIALLAVPVFDIPLLSKTMYRLAWLGGLSHKTVEALEHQCAAVPFSAAASLIWLMVALSSAAAGHFSPLLWSKCVASSISAGVSEFRLWEARQVLLLQDVASCHNKTAESFPDEQLELLLSKARLRRWVVPSEAKPSQVSRALASVLGCNDFVCGRQSLLHVVFEAVCVITHEGKPVQLPKFLRFDVMNDHVRLCWVLAKLSSNEPNGLFTLERTSVEAAGWKVVVIPNSVLKSDDRLREFLTKSLQRLTAFVPDT